MKNRVLPFNAKMQQYISQSVNSSLETSSAVDFYEEMLLHKVKLQRMMFRVQSKSVAYTSYAIKPAILFRISCTDPLVRERTV